MGNRENFFRQILDQVGAGVYFVDPQRRITYWNKGAEAISGYSSEEVQGRSCYDNLLAHSNDAGEILCSTGCPLQETIRDGKKRRVEVFLQHKDGVRVPVSVYAAPIRDDEGRITGAVEVFEDLRPVRHLEQTIEELTDKIHLDEASGALSRQSIEGLVESRWDQYIRGGNDVCLVFADVDNLKAINDRYGHMAGDEAIRHMATTLKNITRDSDRVGRWGGDEFLLLLPTDHPEQMHRITQKFSALLGASHATYDGQRIRVSASFGVALFSEATSLEGVLKLADSRMYGTKAQSEPG